MSIRLSFVICAVLLSACSTPSKDMQEPAPVHSSLTQVPLAHSPDLLTRIAFGSCNKQDLPQPLWRKLTEEKPQLFIWTGDVIYGKTTNIAKLSQVYVEQLQQPEYLTFLASHVPLIGVYDDNDYGPPNGGAEFSQRAASQKLFLDFIAEPQESARRKQEGIYTAYSFGPAGKRVKVLLLDTRYHRQEPGPEADILGAAQWSWLENELAKPEAELLLLVSSIQVLPSEHRFEKWANFPRSRQRLLQLLDRTALPQVVLISGDRHIAELSRLILPSGRTLYEITSSGLTHSYREFKEEKNSLRQGPVVNRLNYGWLELDWAKAKPAVTVQVRDINKQPLIQQTLTTRKLSRAR